jgi:hypothetical protein
MAQLMAIPIRDDGHAVLIITNCEGVILMGFVQQATLGAFFGEPPTMCQCMDFVKAHLAKIERVLLHKSTTGPSCDEAIACVEIELVELVGAGIAELH